MLQVSVLEVRKYIGTYTNLENLKIYMWK